jgi:putative copper export protein
MYEFLLSVHLLAAVVWVGGSVALTVLAARLTPDERLQFAPHFDFYGGKVITGAAFVLILAGIGLVNELDSVKIGDLWIIIGLAGWVASAAIGMGVFGPAGKTIQATRESDPATAHAAYARIATFSRIDTLIVLLVVVDMAVKPGN